VEEEDNVDGHVPVRWREGELGQREKVKARERGRWAFGGEDRWARGRRERGWAKREGEAQGVRGFIFQKTFLFENCIAN
jgi:hypothetical protein